MAIHKKKKDIPRWYLITAISLAFLAFIFLATQGNMIADSLQFILGSAWLILNIVLIFYFSHHEYRSRALLLPIYYLFIFIGVSIVSFFLLRAEVNMKGFTIITVLCASIFEIIVAGSFLGDINRRDNA